MPEAIRTVVYCDTVPASVTCVNTVGNFKLKRTSIEYILFFFFFLTKEYIHAIPHRQTWLHGAYLQSFDTTTTLMKLFLLAYRLQVMT